MSDRSARIFDLDGSVTSQSRLVERLGDDLDVVDLRETGPNVRYIPSKHWTERLDESVRAPGPAWLAFTGSGDFHHVTASLLKRFDEPISVVVFDQHTDWIGSSPCPCGSWILDALKMPNIAKFVSIGTWSTSVQGWRINHGPVSEILAGRVEFYPYDCGPSRCLGRRKGKSACASIEHKLLTTELHWQSIVNNDWETLVRRVIDGLPTSKVYLTIDKDCLVAASAFTNWGPGYLTLDQLTSAVRILNDSKEIVGVDVCGEYSKIEVANRALETMAVRIHPKLPEPSEADLCVNEETNLAIVDVLGYGL